MKWTDSIMSWDQVKRLRKQQQQELGCMRKDNGKERALSGIDFRLAMHQEKDVEIQFPYVTILSTQKLAM